MLQDRNGTVANEEVCSKSLVCASLQEHDSYAPYVLFYFHDRGTIANLGRKSCGEGFRQ